MQQKSDSNAPRWGHCALSRLFFTRRLPLRLAFEAGGGAAGRAYLTYNLSLRSLTSLFVVLSGGQTAFVDCYYVHSLRGIGHTKPFSVLFHAILLVFVKH